jgi:drug/metabolite transporter (DMT)-like permease
VTPDVCNQIRVYPSSMDETSSRESMTQENLTTRLRERLFANPYLLLALTALFWSGNHVLGRAIAGHVPPFGISMARWLVGAIVLWPVARQHVRTDWPIIRPPLPIIALLALSGGALFGAGQYLGLQYTTALNVSVMNSLAPVLIAGTAAILFRDRLAPIQMTGIAVSFAGVLVIAMRGDLNVLAHLSFNLGDLIIMANMMVWAIYCCLLRFKPRMHWLSFIWVFSAISGLAMVPAHVWEHRSGFPFHADWETASSIAYVAIFPSILAFLFWNRGVELIGANRASAFLHLTPIYSAILASVMLGEHLQAYHVIGFALILSGVRFASKKA